MVPIGLFAIDTVNGILLQGFDGEFLESRCTPACAAIPERPGHRRNEQPRQLTQQMIVGRGKT
jgi:hypothetical protein